MTATGATHCGADLARHDARRRGAKTPRRLDELVCFTDSQNRARDTGRQWDLRDPTASMTVPNPGPEPNRQTWQDQTVGNEERHFDQALTQQVVPPATYPLVTPHTTPNDHNQVRWT